MPLERRILLTEMMILTKMGAMTVPRTFRRTSSLCRKARDRLLVVAPVTDLVAVTVAALMMSAPMMRRKMRHLHLHRRILRLGLGRAGNLKFPLARRYGTSMRTGRLSLVGRLKG